MFAGLDESQYQSTPVLCFDGFSIRQLQCRLTRRSFAEGFN
ncbi:hypothetical protein PF003_g12913 [Phytophthora fragariae]|nr:hypothetical protein PF003_g12913 [Phytophthora fragariae]